MDVFEYINSTTIKKHLKTIKYTFSTKEASYLVWQSNHHSLEQKHRAYKEIIKSMPDEKIEKRPNLEKIDSIHKYLLSLIKIENKLFEDIKNKSDESVYQVRLIYPNDYSVTFENEIFSSFKKAYDHCLKNNDVIGFEIRKSLLDANKYNSIEYKKINGDFLPFSITSTFSQNEEDIISAFEGLFLKFPTPFKKGDIVCFNENKTKNTAFVLYALSTWGNKEYKENGYKIENLGIYNDDDGVLASRLKDGDITDMCVYGYFLDEDGMFYSESECPYLDLELFSGKLATNEKKYLALSNFLKKKIDESLLLDSFMHLTLKELLDKSRASLDWFTKEGLKLGGVEDD